MKNAISWFEIPTSDLARAQQFYETIMGITFTKLDLPNIKMRMFPIEDPMGIGGALVPFLNPPGSADAVHPNATGCLFGYAAAISAALPGAWLNGQTQLV